MARPEVDQEAIRQSEIREGLEAEFGPQIGHALWQYQGGLELLKDDVTLEQRIELMRLSEIQLAEAISEAQDSPSPHERFLGVQAQIRVSTINSNR